MKVYQVIAVFKHDLEYQVLLVSTFKSFKNALNYIQLQCCSMDCEKVDGPRNSILGDIGEYVASCRIYSCTSCGFEDFYIKACPILDERRKK